MIEVSGNQIATNKIQIKDVFADDMWYSIPGYQRPYVWGEDEIITLLDDIAYAAQNQPENQYFLGSMVLHCDKQIQNDTEFQENIVLDGQQRLTTLYLIHSVIRDRTNNKTRHKTCHNAIFQEGNEDYGIPEKMRLEFAVRQEVSDFMNQFIVAEGGTQKLSEIINFSSESNNVSIRNIGEALRIINQWFDNENNLSMDLLFPFLSMKVILIYVASAELDDAFRLFTILNDRGIKLRNSDILKAQNLREVSNEIKEKKYARFWEELEGDLEEDFDQFLSYIRTIIVKEKARVNLLKEFQDNIYTPSSYDKTTKTRTSLPPLLKKGEETFELISRYKKHYDEIFSGNNFDISNNHAFDNLIKILEDTAASDIWIPPLLSYREHFGKEKLFDFLKLLDNKFSGDWISRETPTTRIENMNDILKKIEYHYKAEITKSEQIDNLLNDEVFKINLNYFMAIVDDSKVYKKKFDRYLLRKVDYLLDAPRYSEKRISYSTMSVEHILPQNPREDSQWLTHFDEETRTDWTNALGNLVLISRRKNSSQGRLDFQDKKFRYFKSCIETFPNSLKVLSKNQWTFDELQDHHNEIYDLINDYYQINS
ncbi:DUF262 domain-containing protein [Marinoscillum pacificum]|uniref:DUF262 domain-containing protein n=1 Tax=Marinoscillum pacificum TaxID=392723 RepID=UPI002157085E|nr:DUF262 domain-containing HNH endonuclease family protein [Marinoscillum pacificum]